MLRIIVFAVIVGVVAGIVLAMSRRNKRNRDDY
jgi:hypothetical protein